MKYSPALRLIGWAILPISLVFFIGSLESQTQRFLDIEGFFLVSFIVSACYFIAIMVSHVRLNGRRAFFNPASETYTLALTLFSLSAHTLNNSGITIFDPYVSWMAVLVVGMHIALLVLPYRKQLPEYLQYFVYAFSGAGMVVAFHLTVFTLPVSWVGIAFSWFFGISTHILVPVWFLAFYLRTILRISKEEGFRFSKAAWWTGVLIPIMVLAGFLAQWGGVQNAAEEAHTEYTQLEEPLFPEWVLFAQRLPENKLAEHVFMAEQFSQPHFYDGSWERLGRGWNEFRNHDPLAFWAGVLYGPLEISQETKLKALEARYDARHTTHRRLWSGSDLSTSRIETRLDLYPEYRLAYMEKELWIHNSLENQGRWSQQEGVYSFYLPDGAVATSLSLWIEGEERFSRLTTKAKADSAYERIVGRERRDPALMHWQEGNRLSVTVFPCTPEADRQFKIGLTLPMTYTDGQLSVRNVPFEGPSVAGIDEKVSVYLQGTNPEQLNFPFSFDETEPGVYVYEGGYRPNWEITCEAPALSQTAFTFAEQSYRPVAATMKEGDFNPATVVLNLNRNWTWYEFRGVWEQFKDKQILTYTPEKLVLTENNLREVFEDGQQDYFRLLPLAQFTDPAHTLVISKGEQNSPFLADLDGSVFASQTRQWLRQTESNLHWWELDGEKAPLVETLQRLRVIQYASGDLDELIDWQGQQKWPVYPESESQIWIPAAQMALVRDSTGAKGEEAPDHLYRLFAFQDVMRSMGRQFFDRKALADTWIRKAEAAYIVTPVSSLVVLETQKDYERFDIKKNQNTLGNAASKGSGAVPEPHEWALLILLLGVMLYLYRQKRTQLSWTR